MRRWAAVVSVLLAVTSAGSLERSASPIKSRRPVGLLATITGTEGDDDLTGTPDMDVIVGLGGTKG